MPKRIRLELSEAERSELARWEKNPPKAYLRERARAILRVAEGIPIYQVAAELRTPVHRTTVREWVQRYGEAGREGLRLRAGRGRKARFSPPRRE
jgi:transposase